MSKKVVSVYGYGRFGRLWADILANDFKVKVYSRRGLKDHEVSNGVEIATKESLFDCDVIFFCVAISSFEQVLIDSSAYLKPDTLFVDTCSVKMMPVEWMLKHLPKNSEIIGTHPMFGPDSYNKNNDLHMVMCDVRTREKNFDFWKNYFMDKRMMVEDMSPLQHDKMVAYSQGITHYIGRVLADLNLQSVSINTLGYEKLLEIIEQTCNDSWQLFLDLQKFNPYTKEMRRNLQHSLDKIHEALE